MRSTVFDPGITTLGTLTPETVQEKPLAPRVGPNFCALKKFTRQIGLSISWKLNSQDYFLKVIP